MPVRRWVAMLVSAVLLPVPGRAAEPGGGTLTDPDGYVSWSGAFEEAYTLASPAQACAVPGVCDEFVLRLELPQGVWSLPEDGLQIAIEWPSEANDLDLFVYGPGGELAAASNGFFASTGESVRIRHAPNGEYRVVVVPRFVQGRMAYQGLAEVERQLVPPSPLRDLLPNLVALPPRNLHFATGAYLFDPGVPGELASCYPEEMAEQGARRCLRFDQTIANLGEGPFELRFRMDGTSVATNPEILQRIYRSDGSFRDRHADVYEFHPAHAHFHYRGFAQSRLWRSNEAGERLGAEPVRVTRKNGFCMIDVENLGFGPGRKGEAPRRYWAPNCLAPTDTDETGTYATNGISVGWADVYNWFLADQFIEVSGLEPGYYLLETVADPGGTVEELTREDNAASVLIRLTETGAEVVGG